MVACSENSSITWADRFTFPRQQQPYGSIGISEQGFVETTFMPLYSVVDSCLTLSQNIRPGSAEAWALRMTFSQIFLALTVFEIRPVFSLSKNKSMSSPFSTAFMNLSVIRIEILANRTFRRKSSFLTSMNSSMSGWSEETVIINAPLLPDCPMVPVVLDR